MAGVIRYDIELKSNVAKLLTDMKDVQNRLETVEGKEYKIKLGVDEKKLENVISNLDKMLTSLGKGTGDFKEFENLSKQLKDIVSEVQLLNKAFGGINDKGASNLLSAINNIDKSLSSLNEHIIAVNKDFGNVGKNVSNNVDQINEAIKATEGLADATKDLKNAQKDAGNKSNIQNIENATNKASQSLEEYTNKWKILTQVGDIGDTKFSATFEKNKGQIESVRWKAKRDDDGNVIYDDNNNIVYEVSSTTISSYQKLEKAIIDADNELRKLEDRKSEILNNDASASTVNLDSLISDQKEYIRLLEQTVTFISQSNKYMLDEQQIIEARNKAKREYALNKGAKQEESNAKAELEIQEQKSKAIEQQTIAQRKKWEVFYKEQESYVSNKYESDAIERNKKAYRELTDAIQQYSEVSKRISSGNILEGDIELAEKLENKISELQKQPILSTKQVDESEEKLVKLYNQLDVIEKKVKKKQEESNAKAESQKYEKESQKLAKEKSISRKAEKQSTQSSVNKALKDQIDAWKKIQNIREKIANSNNSDEIKALNESKEIYQKQYISADKVLKANSDLYDKETQLLKLEQIRLETNTKIAKYKGDAQETQISSAEEYLNKFQSKLSSLELKPDVEHRFPKYTEQIKELNNAINTYSDYITSLRNKQNNGGIITDEEINKIQRYEKDITDLFNKAKKFTTGEKGYEDISATKAAAQINKILEDNTRISKKAKEQIKALYAEVSNGAPTRPIKEILNDAFKILQLEKEAGRGGKSFFSAIKEKMWYGAAGQIANMFSFYDIINYTKQGISTVRELDTAFTEMRKVSDETVNSLRNYQATTFDTADAVGTTAKQIQDSTADWMGEILVPLYGNI